MSILEHYPLGTAIPDTPHAVCSSLPTMADVIAYEEKDPACRAAMKQGYPRFVRHNYVERVIDALTEKYASTGEVVFPVSSEKAAKAMLRYAGVEGSVSEEGGFVYLRAEANEDQQQRMNDFFQHTGFAISSRQAEDYLSDNDYIDGKFAEESSSGNAEELVLTELKDLCTSESEPYLCRSGMSAIYASMQAAVEIQKLNGRNVWIQLGWLYLDTQRLLEKFLPEGSVCVKLIDVFDMEAIESTFNKYSGKIAGIITEVPTNPLVQTADIIKISELAQKEGAIRIFDPSITSLANLDLTPHCDIQVSSLTKYAACNGDVMSGFLNCNPASSFLDAITNELPSFIEKPFERDLARLAVEISSWKDNLSKVNRNCIQLVQYLEEHPSIDRVYWAYQSDSAENYRTLAGNDDSPGGIININLKKPLADFYDRAKLVKGPSFGTFFTMMCPFMFLAHYDQVSTDEGRKELWSQGLDPDSVRISCGAEPFEEIRQSFDDAL